MGREEECESEDTRCRSEERSRLRLREVRSEFLEGSEGREREGREREGMRSLCW